MALPPDEQGGDPACWTHLFDEDRPDPAVAPGREPRRDLADREDVEVLVRAFYRDAATDDLLGPVFEAAAVDWPAHIATLVDFWSQQLFGERDYAGNPLRAHQGLQASTPFRPAHYRRWLELFDATIDDGFRGPVADLAKARAAKMARALERLMDGVTTPGDVPLAVTLAPPLGVVASSDRLGS